jgi:hypothetical protein
MDNYKEINRNLKQKNKTKRKMSNYPLSKNTSSHKKLIKEKINNKLKENENNQSHSQFIKLDNIIIKESRRKIKSKNHFSERQNKIQHKGKLVGNRNKVKDYLCPFNSISSKNYHISKQNIITKEKSTNRNLDKNKFSKLKFEKSKKEEAYINVSLQKEKCIEINRLNMTQQKNSNNKNAEKIDVSNNEDEILTINNEDKNENNFKVINTIFPKLSSNPFLTLNIENHHLPNSTNSKNNNRNNIKIFFSPNITRKKSNKKTILYNTSKTRAIISLNSSTSQNSNDTKNNISHYNLDLKTKKKKDLNSNIYIEGEAEKEKNNNINQNKINEENNANLIIEDLLNLAKNGQFSEILEKLRKIKKNSINLNYKDKETGNSLLHFAYQGNNTKLIKYLIELNCDINAKNNKNQTPLHLASMKGDLEICKFLVENGALLNVYDSKKYTPIHYACYNNFIELINYFFEIYVEIDTDEKSSYNFSKNKDISTLFHNYLKNKQIDISLLHFSDLNYEYLDQQHHTSNTDRRIDNKCEEKNSFQKSKVNSKSKNKEIKSKTLEVNKAKNNVINLKYKKDKNKDKDLNSNNSSNISNEVINEYSNILKNSSNKSKSKYKKKKYKKDSYKTISLKAKNLSNNILFISLPINFKKINDSQLKNKENNNYNIVNETAYINESHMNLKLNKIEKKSKKSKKNFLTLCTKKKDNNNTSYTYTGKLSKSHKKINLYHKKKNI